jgi:hypothetical protein
VSHFPSPHVAHLPQSTGQLLQFSVGWQVPSPHVWQTPQSCGQLVQFSVLWHTPSPQPGHWPQSSGQVEQVSPSLQVPSPHLVVTLPPVPGWPPVPTDPPEAPVPVPPDERSTVRPQPARLENTRARTLTATTIDRWNDMASLGRGTSVLEPPAAYANRPPIAKRVTGVTRDRRAVGGRSVCDRRA